MSRKDLVVVAFWLLLIVILVVIAYYVMLCVAELLATVVAAAIGLASAFMLAIFKFALAKEQELELLRERMKRVNYLQILDRIAKYVRTAGADNDLLASAHFASCVFGYYSLVGGKGEASY